MLPSLGHFVRARMNGIPLRISFFHTHRSRIYFLSQSNFPELKCQNNFGILIVVPQYLYHLSYLVLAGRKYFTIECQRYLFATFYSNKLKLVFQKIFQIFQIILMKQKYFGHDTGTNFNLGSTIRIWEFKFQFREIWLQKEVTSATLWVHKKPPTLLTWPRLSSRIVGSLVWLWWF